MLLVRALSSLGCFSRFHSAPVFPFRGVEDFFEPEFAGKVDPNKVPRVGRPWLASELRTKNFDDLQKLWYVLVKERNMLLTERERLGNDAKTYLIPQRLIKVRKSMARIQTVVGERSREHKAIKLEDNQAN